MIIEANIIIDGGPQSTIVSGDKAEFIRHVAERFGYYVAPVKKDITEGSTVTRTSLSGSSPKYKVVRIVNTSLYMPVGMKGRKVALLVNQDTGTITWDYVEGLEWSA